MPKIPTARRQSALEPTKGELLAEHLTGIAMLRGLYYTALYDKLGENLKLFGVSVDTDCDNELWARTQSRATQSSCGSSGMTYSILWMVTVRLSTSPRSSDYS